MAKISWHSRYTNIYDTTVFRSVEAGRMDEVAWIGEADLSRQFKLPHMSEIDFSAIPKSYFQSGTGLGEDLDLKELNFLDEHKLTGWYPGVRRGIYRIENNSYYLHSSRSVSLIASRQSNKIGSIMSLPSIPDVTVPIQCSYLERDPDTLGVRIGETYSMVKTLTPLTENGRELNGTTDPTKSEFKLVIGSADRVNFSFASLPITIAEVAPNEWSHMWRLDFTAAPWHEITLSRPDVFKRRVPAHTLFGPGRASGDYSIQYENAFVLIRLRLDSQEPRIDYGHGMLQEMSDCRLEFNKDVSIPHSSIELTISSDPRRQGVEYYLPTFPVQQFGAYPDSPSVFNLRVNGVSWIRVFDLSTAPVPDAQVYELDRHLGIVKFGSGTEEFPGARPDSGDTVTATYFAAPLITYDEPGVRPIFDDTLLDIDPITTTLRQGFIVLANEIPVPWKITLSTSTDLSSVADCIYGPLRIPPAQRRDFSPLRATVTAKNGEPVPNVSLKFVSLDGLLNFSNESGITDAAGNVYTEAFADGDISRNLLTVNLWSPTAENNILPGLANIDNSSITSREPPGGNFTWKDTYPFLEYGHHEPQGHSVAPWTANTIVVEDLVSIADPSTVLLFIVSVPEYSKKTFEMTDGSELEHTWLQISRNNSTDSFAPYRAKNQLGGLASVWLQGDERYTENVEGNLAVDPPMVVAPVYIETTNNRTYIIFDRALPLPWRWDDGVDTTFQPPKDLTNIMQYRLVLDRISQVRADTTSEPLLESNILSFSLTLNENMRGQFQIIDPDTTNLDYQTVGDTYPIGLRGTRLDSATFLTPVQPVIYHIEDDSGNLLALAGDDPGFPGGNQSALDYLLDTAFTIRIFTDATHYANNFATRPGAISTLGVEMPPRGQLDDFWLKPNIFIIQVNTVTNVIDKVIRLPASSVEPAAVGTPGDHYLEVALPALSEDQVAETLGGSCTAYLALNGFSPGDNLKWEQDGEFPRSSIRINFTLV